MKSYKIDGILADSIALQSLREHRKMTQKQLKKHRTGKRTLHTEDLEYNIILEECFSKIIAYYGGK